MGQYIACLPSCVLSHQNSWKFLVTGRRESLKFDLKYKATGVLEALYDSQVFRKDFLQQHG